MRRLVLLVVVGVGLGVLACPEKRIEPKVGKSEDGGLAWSVDSDGLVTFAISRERSPVVDVAFKDGASWIIADGSSVASPVWVYTVTFEGVFAQPCSEQDVEQPVEEDGDHGADCNPPPCRPTGLCPPESVSRFGLLHPPLATELGIDAIDGLFETQRLDLYLASGEDALSTFEEGEPAEVEQGTALWSVKYDVANQPCLSAGDCPPDPCELVGLCPPRLKAGIDALVAGGFSQVQ